MKTSFLHIEIDLFMAILLGIITIHSILQLNLKLLRYKLFVTTATFTLVNLFIEIITFLARSSPTLNSAVISRFLTTLSFVLSPFTPLFVYYFVIKTTTGRFNKKKALLISIPAIFNIIISIANYGSNIIFRISDRNIYSRESFFFIPPLISVCYYLLIMIYILKNTYYLETDEIFVFLNAVLLPFILGTIQIVNSYYLTVCSSYAISVVILYIFILNDNSKRDPMTGLGNKAKYYDCISMLNSKRCRTLKIISFDLDDFKKINDTYGHYQGDLAIQTFASLVYETFKVKSKIVRFGGDEFVIFTFNDKVYSLLKLLSMKVDKFNSENIVPFELKYSYGIADQCNTENTGLSIEELLKKSDEQLYINKKLKKSY